MTDQQLVNLIGVSKVYDGTAALKGIDLYIRRNEFLTLLGPSGCGKTTTLRLIGVLNSRQLAGFCLKEQM